MAGHTEISFRRVKKCDIGLLFQWLNKPHVIKWYDGGESYNELEKKVVDRVDGREPVEPYIIVFKGKDIGYIQTYLIKDFPEYALLTGVGENTAGIDLYIGESDYIHRGLGKHIMIEFLRTIVFVKPGIESCIVGPEPANLAAIKAYKKTGFEYIKTIQVPGEKEPEEIYIIHKKDIYN